MSAPIQVICDRCRAEGQAGDPAFSAIQDILAFEPVPRRAHVNNWTAEHQRAFIAALAMTGSPRQAARAIGRHMHGAQQLRTARGGRSFDEAWDAAMSIAREREFARIHAGLAGLAAGVDSAPGPHPGPASAGRTAPALFEPDDDEDYEQREFAEAQASIAEKLLRARRLYLAELVDDEACRLAWEILVGPTDWDKAAELEPQDNEHLVNGVLPWMRAPDMLLTAENGWLGEWTGTVDKKEVLRARLAELQSTESKTNDGEADASAWSRDASPNRPGCDPAGSDSFDVTDSLRDDLPSSAPSSADPTSEEADNER